MILFFDDEALYVKPYVDSLRAAGFVVEFVANAAASLKFFRERIADIDLAVVDIMSPILEPLPPEFDLSKVDEGLRTGVELLRAMNQDAKGRGIPKLILTNVDTSGFEASMNQEPGVVSIRRKKDILPSGLAEEVKHILRR